MRHQKIFKKYMLFVCLLCVQQMFFGMVHFDQKVCAIKRISKEVNCFVREDNSIELRHVTSNEKACDFQIFAASDDLIIDVGIYEGKKTKSVFFVQYRLGKYDFFNITNGEKINEVPIVLGDFSQIQNVKNISDEMLFVQGTNGKRCMYAFFDLYTAERIHEEMVHLFHKNSCPISCFSVPRFFCIVHSPEKASIVDVLRGKRYTEKQFRCFGQNFILLQDDDENLLFDLKEGRWSSTILVQEFPTKRIIGIDCCWQAGCSCLYFFDVITEERLIDAPKRITDLIRVKNVYVNQKDLFIQFTSDTIGAFSRKTGAKVIRDLAIARKYFDMCSKHDVDTVKKLIDCVYPPKKNVLRVPEQGGQKQAIKAKSAAS